MEKLLSVLHKQPWLRFVNINNISSRLLKHTDGDCFIVFNIKKNNYELHARSSMDERCDTYNATIPKELLNEWLIRDFKATNHKKFAQELYDERRLNQFLYEKQEEKNEGLLSQKLKIVERTLGRRL